jgi:hypothetical protein
VGRLFALASLASQTVHLDWDGSWPTMARRKLKPPVGDFVLFDVVYEDSSRTSNRRVPSSAVGGLDGDEPVRHVIEEQDRAISDKSGRPPLQIKNIERSQV